MLQIENHRFPKVGYENTKYVLCTNVISLSSKSSLGLILTKLISNCVLNFGASTYLIRNWDFIKREKELQMKNKFKQHELIFMG